MTLRILSGKFKGRSLASPKGETRPTAAILRQALFNICQHHLSGTHFLDLFAGSGAIGLEALSCGAANVCFVEKERSALRCIRENIAALQVEKETNLYAADYRSALARLEKQGELFDLVFIDPPYTYPIAPILEELLSHHLLRNGAFVFVEERFSNSPPFSSEKLICLDSRRFGDAQLRQYLFKQDCYSRN